MVISRFTRRRGLRLAPGALAFGLGPGFGFGPRRGVAAHQAPTPLTLLVRGETTFSSENAPVAWRIVRDVAEVEPDARYERRALGFSVATDPFGALLLTDDATGSACRLAPGEAAFVREGTFQRRASLAERAQSYLRIGLVDPAAAGDAGGDRLLFAGTAFPAPGRAVTLTLHRVEPAVGEAMALPPGDGEVLLLVEQGSVELETSIGREALTTTVGSDTAYAVRALAGRGTLRGTRAATAVLIASLS